MFSCVCSTFHLTGTSKYIIISLQHLHFITITNAISIFIFISINNATNKWEGEKKGSFIINLPGENRVVNFEPNQPFRKNHVNTSQVNLLLQTLIQQKRGHMVEPIIYL